MHRLESPESAPAPNNASWLPEAATPLWIGGPAAKALPPLRSASALQESAGRQLLRRLRGAVVQDADDHDAVGVDVQAQLEGLILFARGLIRANFGAIGGLVRHIVGGCSAFGARPPTTHVISKCFERGACPMVRVQSCALPWKGHQFGLDSEANERKAFSICLKARWP